MDLGHLERILQSTEGKNLLDALAELTPTDLQSLLLEASKQRAQKLTPSSIAARSCDDRFSHHSKVDPPTMIQLERIAFDVSAQYGFQPMELSPVCPLGTVTALAKVSQNNIV